MNKARAYLGRPGLVSALGSSLAEHLDGLLRPSENSPLTFSTEWVKGKSLDEAQAIKNTDIAEELELPPVKIHCSILAEDAIKAAIADYKSKREAK